MSQKESAESPHPTGESISRRFPSLPVPSGAWPVDTPGGRIYAEWSEETPTTREGQLLFFAQFLQASHLWETFLKNCPLHYHGNRGSGAKNVMGTLLLSILCGHWRYAHINSVRGDSVNAAALGLDRLTSEDVVRSAMKRIPETEGLDWVQGHLLASIDPVLDQPWILDIDNTVKCVYGNQQGAEKGYNPTKPGRPSLNYHSYFMANTRICLGVDVCSGKKHSGKEGMRGLWRLLEALPRAKWPTFVRGDSGYGNEEIMVKCEQEGLPYVFKLRMTRGVKSLVRACMRQDKAWQDAGKGWETMEARLKLHGWTRSRRVVVVREAVAVAPVDGRRRGRDVQQELEWAEGFQAGIAPWSGKISVVVTSLDATQLPLVAIPQLYRERADAENIYDELKNQWGWNGFTTRKLAPTRLTANLVALFYNWWHLYVRLYDAEHHREAITSRPALMQGVGRQTTSGGQRKVLITLVHEKAELIARLVTFNSKQMQEFMRITERWTVGQKWHTLLTLIFRPMLGGKWLSGVPPAAAPLLSG